MLGDKRSAIIEYVCSDMWKPYLQVIEERIGHSLNILDRFHIVARLNKALNDVRASEHRRMKQDGYEPILTKARWLLLKRPENLTEDQDAKLKDKDGKPVRWSIEWGAAGQLAQQGVRTGTLKVGDKVVVTGSPGRNPEDYRLRMRSITRPSDGWKWPVGNQTFN